MVTRFHSLNGDFTLNRDSLNRYFTVYCISYLTYHRGSFLLHLKIFSQDGSGQGRIGLDLGHQLGPEGLQEGLCVAVRGALQSGHPMLPLKLCVSSQMLFGVAKVQDDAEGGLILVLVVQVDGAVLNDDDPGGLGEVIPRAEVEEQVASQATPSLNRHCERKFKCDIG